jgi:hypothetical protein
MRRRKARGYATLHSWHLMVSGGYYLAFFVAAVFAVI